jgi:transposase-like protein
MSKIPQGDWNAIAARYAQGESISRIAQSYGCTPPAIHYILKRYRQRTATKLEQPPNRHGQLPPALADETRQSSAPREIARSTGPNNPEHQAARLTPGVGQTTQGRPIEAPLGRDREVAPVRPAQPAFPQQRPGHPRNRRASALAPALDNELHGRAEAAIEAFRSSFDAALAEASPVVRQRLREAASDLMRVAARTTIVLDQLNARAERSTASAKDGLGAENAR